MKVHEADGVEKTAASSPTDTDAIHDNTAGEIAAVTAKGTPVGGDFLVIEDSEAGNVKKSITIEDIDHALLGNTGTNDHAAIDTHLALTNEHIDWTGGAAGTIHTDNYIEGGAGSDIAAIHGNSGSEINALSDKASPASGDLIIIEDSDASFVKKKVSISNLPAGGETNDLETDGMATSAEHELAVGTGSGNAVYAALAAGAVGYSDSTHSFEVAGLSHLEDVTAKTGTGTTVVMDTSPTIVTPVIASFTTAQHDHADAAGGGVVDHVVLGNTGTNDHATIDTHLGAANPHSGSAASATTITVAGTANQVTSSAGAQDLSTNRTWTLSLPTTLIIPGSLEVPNAGGGGTIDVAGKIGIDTTSRTLNFHDGTEEVRLNPLIGKGFFLETPTADDDFPVYRFDAASTLVKVVYGLSGGTNWIGQLQEADDAIGTNGVTTQAADSTVTAETTVTSFVNASFDAGDYARILTTSISGTPAYVHVMLYYRENP